LRRSITLMAALATAAFFMSGCWLFQTTVVVGGTITGDYWTTVGKVTLAFSSSDGSFGGSSTLDTGSPTQTGTYSISDVLVGSYTLVVEFVTPNDWAPVSPATYSIVGGAQAVVADNDQYTSGVGDSTHTLTFDKVPVGDADTTIDVYLGDGG
jgi:hypothetical protein